MITLNEQNLAKDILLHVPYYYIYNNKKLFSNGSHQRNVGIKGYALHLCTVPILHPES